MRRPLAISGAFLWGALIWWASSLTPSKIPVKLDWLQAFGPTVWNFAHFWVFGILGVLLGCAIDPSGRTVGIKSRAGQAALVCVMVYAVLDESHQWTVPQRTCSLADVVLDTMGALFMLTWSGFPFGVQSDRPARNVWSATALLLGLVLSYLGATMDIPGDGFLSTFLDATFRKN